MAEVAASVKASPFRVNPAMYRPPGNAACSWKRPETSSYAPDYRVTIRLSRFKLCYWSLLEAPVCTYSVSSCWKKRLRCM